MTTPDHPQMNSIVAVDFGNVRTRAILIELVEGAYTLIASATELSTHAFPANDPGVALLRALRHLSELGGRRLISGERVITPEAAARSGVDAFVATSSVGQPLRTVVLGLMPGLSLASALRATAGTYVSVVEALALEEVVETESALNTLLLARPDLIFISGGVDGGAAGPVRQLADVAALALRLVPRDERPMVLYAGNAALAPEMNARFSELTTVFTAPNLRANARREQIAPAQLQLASAFDLLTEHRNRGFVAVGEQSRVGVLPNAQSYHLIAAFMGQSARPRPNVLIVDVGSATSTLATSVRGHASTVIRTDVGVGHSAVTLLDAAGLDAVRAWLPFAASDTEIMNFALNKAARPAQVPDSLRALYLEHALLRAGLRVLLNASRPSWGDERAAVDRRSLPVFQRMIGAGGALTGVGRPGMAAMLLLDALQPVGITRLEMDPDALIPALGAVARFNPQAVVQLIDQRGLDLLGACVNLSGRPRRDKPAARVRLTMPNGEVVRATVIGGQLWRYPLGLGVRARLDVRALGRLNIAGKRSVRLNVVGGAAGVIIDARGRPLPLAADIKARSAQLTAWYAQATGDPIREIQPEWLQELMLENARTEREDAASVPKGRRARRKAGKAAGQEPAPVTASDDALPDLDALITPTPVSDSASRPGRAPTVKDEVDDLRNLLS